MLKKNMKHWRGGFLLLIFLFTGAICPSFGAERQLRQRPVDSRKEQQRKEAQQSFQDVDKLLTQILEKVNKNQTPADDLITQAAAKLKECKRDSLAYEDNQQAGYMLLGAWISYYQGNLPDAMRWSLRACKTDDTNQDAWVSQAVFSMLSDKRPILPRVKKPRKNRPRRTRNNNRVAPGMMPGMDPGASSSVAPEQAMRKGTLEFDLTMLGSGAIKEHFEKLGFQEQLVPLIGFDPNENTLCLLFWQDDETDAKGDDVSDANDVTEEPKTEKENLPGGFGMPGGFGQQGMPGMPGMMGHSLTNQNVEAASTKGQQQYFGRLFKACKEHPQITFLQINTNHAEIAKKVAEKRQDDSETKKDAPLFFVADFGVDTTPFAALNATGPLMLIIGDGGKLKYTGPATTFVPAFILSAITDVELDLEKMVKAEQEAKQAKQTRQVQRFGIRDPNKPAETVPMPQNMPMPPGMAPPGMMPGMMPFGVPPVPQRKPVDPNAPASPQGATYRQLSPEDQVRAQNLLREGHFHIEQSRKVGGKNPKVGIEACRKVLAKYGDTEYVEAARALLRRVPDRYKKDYEISDEELGL